MTTGLPLALKALQLESWHGNRANRGTMSRMQKSLLRKLENQDIHATTVFQCMRVIANDGGLRLLHVNLTTQETRLERIDYRFSSPCNICSCLNGIDSAYAVHIGGHMAQPLY